MTSVGSALHIHLQILMRWKIKKRQQYMRLANSNHSSNLFYLSRSQIFLARDHHPPDLNHRKCENVNYRNLFSAGAVWLICEDVQVNYFYSIRTIPLMRCEQKEEGARS